MCQCNKVTIDESPDPGIEIRAHYDSNGSAGQCGSGQYRNTCAFFWIVPYRISLLVTHTSSYKLTRCEAGRFADHFKRLKHLAVSAS